MFLSFKNYIIRFLNFSNRIYQSKKIGVKFFRSKKFKLPYAINYKGKNYKVFSDYRNQIGSIIAFLDIFLDDVYYMKEIQKNLSINNVIDIGGHTGFFSMYCKLLFPFSTIHCYEPNPKLFSSLNDNANEFGFYVFPFSVGYNEAFVDLKFSNDTVLTKTVLNENGTIKQISFNKVVQKFNKNIDLLKLDCEGAEWDIFKDIESFKRIKCITMEFHLTDNINEEYMKNVFLNIGFEVKKINFHGPTWGTLYALNINYN
jgi:FkbM family methyltransferase